MHIRAKLWTSTPKSVFFLWPGDGGNFLTSAWAMTWGGVKRMGGGKRTEQRTLQRISGPLEKSVWSGQSSAFLQGKKEQRHQRGVENVPNDGGPKSLFCRGVIGEVFLPPPFSTPPWRPLTPARPGVSLVGVLRGNTIRGNTTRNSERKMAL